MQEPFQPPAAAAWEVTFAPLSAPEDKAKRGGTLCGDGVHRAQAVRVQVRTPGLQQDQPCQLTLCVEQGCPVGTLAVLGPLLAVFALRFADAYSPCSAAGCTTSVPAPCSRGGVWHCEDRSGTMHGLQGCAPHPCSCLGMPGICSFSQRICLWVMEEGWWL